MEDIAPKLLEKIQADYNKRFADSKKIEKIYRKIQDGTATYADVSAFAQEAGDILAKAIQANISSDILPNGKMYYNIAKRILQPTMENNHNITADATERVQELLNKKSKTGIKAIKPKVNQSRIDGLIDVLSGAEKYDAVSESVPEAIINFTMAVVDEAVRANAEFQSKAGLSPQIKRSVSGGCCDWCAKLAGVYNYEEVKDTGNAVFRRHQYCRCLVEYIPGEKYIQNAHSKKWSDADDISQRIKNSQRYEENRRKAEKQEKEARKALSKTKGTAIIRLPKHEDAVIPKEKFTQYALNPLKSPEKAEAFEKALGYTLKDADELAQKIRDKLPDYPAVQKGDRGWGMTYEVVMEIEGKNGKKAKVLTAWIADRGNGEMRMTTVHIDD